MTTKQIATAPSLSLRTVGAPRPRPKLTKLAAGLAFAASVFTAGLAQAETREQAPTGQAADQAPKKNSAKPSRYTLEGQLNVNTAGANEWVLLPGIGPSTAAKIIAYRDQTPFESLEELVKVRGIGRKTLGRIRGYLKMSGDSNLKRSKISAR